MRQGSSLCHESEWPAPESQANGQTPPRNPPILENLGKNSPRQVGGYRSLSLRSRAEHPR
jgi:hypothetical protein